jgi:GNAT superfamily N-acetyltransferase
VERSRDDGYSVSDDKSRLDVERIYRWLCKESYWAAGRPIETIRRSIENSIAFGCYDPTGVQVGFCRWVTDEATFGWLCDMFVDDSHRQKGLGVFLVGSAMDHPAIQGIRLLLLATRDAHGLYAKFGFTNQSDMMERRLSLEQVIEWEERRKAH